jgi:hypothetical protein
MRKLYQTTSCVLCESEPSTLQGCGELYRFGFSKTSKGKAAHSHFSHKNNTAKRSSTPQQTGNTIETSIPFIYVYDSMANDLFTGIPNQNFNKVGEFYRVPNHMDELKKAFGPSVSRMHLGPHGDKRDPLVCIKTRLVIGKNERGSREVIFRGDLNEVYAIISFTFSSDPREKRYVLAPPEMKRISKTMILQLEEERRRRIEKQNLRAFVETFFEP